MTFQSLPYVLEGDQYVMAITGANPVRNIRVRMSDGSTPTVASPAMTVYKGSTDVSSTYLTGAMPDVSGDIIRSKTWQNLVAGDNLFVVYSATVNGIVAAVASYWLHVIPLSGMTAFPDGIPYLPGKDKDQYEYAVSGANPVRNIRVPTRDGSVPIITSPTMTMYLGGTDVSSTYLTGSMSVASGRITTKSFQNLVPGNFFITIAATVSGITDTVGCYWLHVLPLSGSV